MGASEGGRKRTFLTRKWTPVRVSDVIVRISVVVASVSIEVRAEFPAEMPEFEENQPVPANFLLAREPELSEKYSAHISNPFIDRA